MIQISNKNRCCGCTACVNICPQKCIDMRYDEEGFLYPFVNSEKCIECHACEKICPFYKHEGKEKEQSIYCAVQYMDEEKRRTSTAGGAFSLIADALIEQNAAVYAVGYDNMVVSHKRVTTQDALLELRGSKYVQSDLKKCFLEIKKELKTGRKILFVGTPCQVHGLRNYVGEHENLFLIDLLCLGVSSPRLFSEYIEYLNSKYKSNVKDVQFRNKHYGYATPNIRVCFENGRYIEQMYDCNVYANLFFKHYYNTRPSCYECQFREIPRVSDFTIGDFTEIGKKSKKLDDDKGTTKVWVHSEKGKRLLNMVSTENNILVLNESESNIVGGPKRQIKKPDDRKAFFDDAQTMTYATLIDKWEPHTVKSDVVGIARKIINKTPCSSVVFKSLRALKRRKYHKQVDGLNGK